MVKWLKRFGALLLVAAVLIGMVNYLAAPTPRTEALAETQEKDFKLLKTGMGGKNVKEMQVALWNLGYYEGKLDGNFSKALAAAVRELQEELGVEATGQIDYDLYSLLIEFFTGFPEPTAAPKKTPKPTASGQKGKATAKPQGVQVDRNGQYTDKEHVAAYIHRFGCLPSNYITKSEARALGWSPTEGNLRKVAPGMSIGGDSFGNYDGNLPEKWGRKYYECDIDYRGGTRNAKRILYSNDGLVFYTEDHYETFEEIP